MHNPTIPLAAIIALLLSACGGGGGGSTAATPPAAITLSATAPSNGATIGNDATPTVTFDIAPDTATITAKSITLSSPVGAVDSRLATNGNTVTVTPASPLVWGSHYQLTISDAVRSSAGGKLSAASTIGFDTRMATWGAVTKVGAPATSTTPVDYASTGSAQNGDAVAVWPQMISSSMTPQLMAMRYTATTESWSAPAAVQGASRLSTVGWRYELDVNGAGNACAAWAEVQDNGDYIIKAARLDAASGWTPPVNLSDAGHYNYGGAPQVAISQNGNIIVAWLQDTDTELIIYAAYYDAASQQWAPARALRKGPTYADFPAVAISVNGTAMVLWSEMGVMPQVMLVHASRYDATTKSWGAAINVQGNTTEISYPSNVAFDANGNVFATWRKYLSNDGSGSAGVGAARYNAATGTWGKAAPLLPLAVFNPQISVDAAGNALLAWTGSSSTNTYTFESSRYQQSSDTWISLPSQKLEASILSAPRMDAAGNGLLTWVGHDGKYTMNAMRYNSGAGKWDAPQVVASDAGYMNDPVLTTDQSGQALLIWSQHTGDSNSNAQVAYSRLSGH